MKCILRVLQKFIAVADLRSAVLVSLLVLGKLIVVFEISKFTLMLSLSFLLIMQTGIFCVYKEIAM